MKKTLIALLLFVLSKIAFAQYEGPIPAISSGYGSDGQLSYVQTTIANDHFPTKDITVFYPEGTTTPVPTIFFSHGLAGNLIEYYIETLRHLASKGYAVVFVPYKTIDPIDKKYLTLFDGFDKAVHSFTSIIDTTRVGFYGHSVGGGATPRISYRKFTENNWGANGKFIYCASPWYSFELGTDNLADFPTDCNMLTVLYDDDLLPDHRMGMDIFNNIAIDKENKDCIIVYSKQVGTYFYDANHMLPTQGSGGQFNALDYYVTFRLLDALADYTFTGNLDAKDIALGNGSEAQINMGALLPDLLSTDEPAPIYPEDRYGEPCSDDMNERKLFCQSLRIVDPNSNKIRIYPNPTNGQVKIHSGIQYQKIEISIFTILGEKVLTIKNQTEIDISHLVKGIYFIKIDLDGKIETSKIIKSNKPKR